MTVEMIQSMPDLAQASHRCTAKSKQSGERCSKYAIPGGNVCHMHGGNAPQVRGKAMERITEARDLALDRLIDALQPPESDLYAVEVKDLLAVVDKLTSKVQLLSGEATSRKEQSVKIEEVRGRLEQRLDALYARVSDNESMILGPIEDAEVVEEVDG